MEAAQTAAPGLMVARQAILDAKRRTVGYELLYRPLGGPSTVPFDGDAASASVLIDGVFGFGLDRLTGGRPAFVNVGESMLTSGDLFEMGEHNLVIEVLEDVPDTPAVRDAVRRLRARGYRVALDDVIADDPRWAMLEMVDLVKIDLFGTTPRERAQLSAETRRAGVELLFEKVETQADADEAERAGAHLLQGYFFAKPQIIQGEGVRPLDGPRMQLLAELNKRELDLAAVEELIRRDLYLTDRFLRLVNAASFGWRRRIDTLRHAIVLLGAESVRRWLSLIVLAAAATGKPNELLVLGATRARFCERLGELTGFPRGLDLFSVGMFSVLDAVLGKPIAEAVDGLPLPDDVLAALRGEDNEVRRRLDVAVALERWEETRVRELVTPLGTDLPTVASAYADAIEWSNAAASLD